MGPTAEGNEEGRAQCSSEGVAGVDELWSSLSELCGDDGGRCIHVANTLCVIRELVVVRVYFTALDGPTFSM